MPEFTEQIASTERPKLSGWQRKKIKLEQLTKENAQLINFCAYLMNRLERYEKVEGRVPWQTK